MMLRRAKSFLCPTPQTAAIIAPKGLEIKDKLISSHANNPFLEGYRYRWTNKSNKKLDKR